MTLANSLEEVTDAEIARLVALPKRVTNPGARQRQQRGSWQINYECTTDTGENFRIYRRQNIRDPESYSCGISYILPSGQHLTLRRYNGPSHEHSNTLEGGATLRLVCHVHRATERYIRAGRKPDHYAEATTRYTTLDGAFLALIEDCNVSGFGNNDDTSQMELL